MDNNMMALMMQMMNQQQQMMTMIMQQMSQPQPDPTQIAQPQIPNQQQIIQDSNAAASISVQEVADLKAEIERLRSQLAERELTISNLRSEMETVRIERNNIQKEFNQLQADIGKVELYEGEAFKGKVERIEGMTGQDYYDDFVSGLSGLNNQEKRELVKAFSDDMEERDNPIYDFETGKKEPFKNRTAQVWEKFRQQHKVHDTREIKKGQPRQMEQVEADKKFESFGKLDSDSFL